MQREINLYTNKENSIVHEVRFFETYALARPITPQNYRDIQKLDLDAFYDEFDDFYGDRDQVRKWMAEVEAPEIEAIYCE